MQKKIIAALVVLLVAIMPVTMIADNLETDAAENDVNTTTPMFRVFYYSVHWYQTDVPAYDGYQALNSSYVSETLGLDIIVLNDYKKWNKPCPADPTVKEPNEKYGWINTINATTDFQIKVFLPSDSEGNGVWVDAQKAMGWYRPFEDYKDVKFPTSDGTPGPSAATANIAIMVGSETTENMPTNVLPLTSISRNVSDAYEFFIQDSTGEVNPSVMPQVEYEVSDGVWTTGTLTSVMLTNGVNIRGYGSDAFLALKDALTNVNGDMITFHEVSDQGRTHMEFYSWIMDVLGAGTETIKDEAAHTVTYKYWNSARSSGDLNYTLGYYSNCPGAYDQDSVFKFRYISETYNVPPQSQPEV